MTEKKKRGRPPGSGKKQSADNQKTYSKSDDQIKQEAADGFREEQTKSYPDGIFELKGNGKRPDGLAIDAAKYNVPPFPSDWGNMGKVDRLKWLKSHNK